MLLHWSKFLLEVEEFFLLYYGVHGNFLNWTALGQLSRGCALCCVACGQQGGCLARLLLDQLSRPQEFDPTVLWRAKSVKLVQSLQWLRLALQLQIPSSSSRIPRSLFSAANLSTELALKQQLLMFLPVVMSHRAERYSCRVVVCTTQGNCECAVVLFWLL